MAVGAHPSDATQSGPPGDFTQGLSGWLTISEEARSALHDRLQRAAQQCYASMQGASALVNDIFSGRDHMSAVETLVPEGGFSLRSLDQTRLRSVSTRPWTPPQTMANLIQARVRLITTALTPGRPTIHVKATLPGDAGFVEAQNRLLQFLMDAAGMDVVTREFAQSALMSPYAGLRVRFQHGESVPANRRVRLEKVDASNCGWEPGLRRFTWHRYYVQYGDLPSGFKRKWAAERDARDSEPKAWDIVQICEVYHPGMLHGNATLERAETRRKVLEGQCPASYFARVLLDGETPEPLATLSLGTYCGTRMLRCSPLIIHHFVTPAPNEDVPPSEILSWLPPLRGIVLALIAITREVSNTNRVILYDNAILQEHIDTLQDAPIGAEVLIPIQTDEKGVAQKMRPVERSSALPELSRALEIYYALFDDVTGVTAMGRGVAENPRKSATEAGALVSASNQRNEDRLKVIAQVWQSVARVLFCHQRELFGTEIEVPIHARGAPGSGQQTLTIPIPDPESTEFSFAVDPVELAHMNRRNEADQLLAWVTIFSNAFIQFRGSIPRIVRESLRRVAFLMGIENADVYLEQPVLESGPEERYIQHLETRKPLSPQPNDDHVLFVAYYTAILERAIQSGELTRVPTAALKGAIAKHQEFLNRANSGINNQAGRSVIPGIGSRGQPSNDTAAALAAGDVGSLFPINQQDIVPTQ